MRTNLLNNLSKGMNFSLTRMCERLCEMWAAMSNHAIITQLSRNNHPIAHRCIRYATALLVVLMVGYGEMWGQTLSFDVTSPGNKSITQNNITVSTSNDIASKTFNGTATTAVWKVDSKPTSITSTTANICKIVFTACNNSTTNNVQTCCVTVSTDGSTYTTLSSGVTVSGATGTTSTSTDNIYANGYNSYSTITVEFNSTNYRYVRIEKDGKETWVNSIKVYTGSSARTYDGEEKMFFLRDSWSWWKDGSAKFYAYFWNSSTGDDAWSGEASWVVQTTSENKDVWGYTVPEGTWDKVIITRGSAASFDDGKTWNKSNDITLEATTNLLTDWTVSGETGHAITWSNITLDGKTVYFDNRNYSTWTSAYVRIGKSDHNAAWGPMTKVGGTKYLYEKETDQYDFHTDLSVADSYGWTNGNNIYQPWENQSWSAPAKISKQTTYQKFGIQRDVYLCPTSTSMLERECQYYNVNGGTSTNTFDNVNTGTVLPQYTVTATGTNCTVSLVEYTADDFSTNNSISSGDAVDPTRYVGVTVTPNSGYEFSSVSLTSSAYEQHTAAAAGVTGKYAILADCEISASCTPETYTITYKDGGGADVPFSGYHIGTPPSTHTYNTATSLKKATKAGYVFGGWYTDYSCTSSAVSSLGKTAYTANITLYAKWTAMSLANLATGTFYGASKIVPKNVTVSSTEQYYPGVATGQLFNVLGTGTSDATTGPMSSKTISSQSLTNTSAVTECMYFKKVATVTSYVPTDHAIQFKLPTPGGQLEVWANDDIYLSDGSSETLVDISGNYAVVKGLAAGTYYLYAKNTSRTLWGIRYKKTHSVYAVTNTGTTTYGTVSADPVTVAEDSTSIITAVPATGYQVTNWAVSGTSASISPSGSSSSLTTTLTMGTANATVTVTFGDASYGVTHTLSNATKSSGETTATHGTDYTAVFAAADGYALPTSITVTISGEPATENTEYTWDKSTGTVVVDGDYITGDIVITITSVQTYTVTYNLNGGKYNGSSDAPTQAAVTSGTSITLPSLTPTKSGYVFASWKCSVGNTYHWESYSYTMTAANTTFTAQWVEAADLTSGTLYMVDDIKPLSVNAALSSTGQYAKGISSNGCFTSIGNPLRTDNSDGTFEFKTETKQTVDDIDFTKHMWFKGASNVTSNVPTSRGLKFSVASAGTLTVYCTRGDRINLSNGTTSAALTSNTSTGIIKREVEIAAAGTYYLYATGGSTRLAGIKFVEETCDDPSASLDNGAYTIGGSALDLRTLWSSSNTTDGVTFSVTNANGTGATIAGDGYSFSATTAGTATISASQTSTGDYCDAAETATITVSNPTYTVTYATTGSTGGSAPTDSDSPYESGSTVTVKGNTGSLVKTGYVFLGWSDGNSNNYAPGETFTISANTTLSPIWKEGTSATITYTMAVGTDNTWSASGSSNETTGIPNAGVTITDTYAGIDSGKGHKNGSTAKLAIQTTAQGATYDSPTNYILYNFSVASGYAFTPSDITIKIANVGEKSANNIKYKAVLSDGSSHSISTTYICTTQDATIETFHLYNEEGVTFDGNVSLKLWAWKISSSANGSSDSGKTGSAYRLGTPLTIAGVTESTATLYDISTSATNGTIAVTVGGASASSAEEDATVTITATPSSGYSFSSWSVAEDDSGDDVSVTSSTTSPTTFTMPAADVTVSATFSEITHTVTVSGGDHGTASTSSVSGVGIATASGNITATPASGYSFSSWTLPDGVTAAGGFSASSNPIQINATADGKTITATWTPVEYTITYTLHDGGAGSVSGNTTYTIEDDDYDLPTPTWSGHVFQGWFDNSSYTGDRIYVLEGGSTGNKTFHAKWGTEVPVAWTITKIDSKLYKGGGEYTVTAVVDNASWTGSASSLVLGASDGVVLGTATTSTNGDSKAQIVANFDITEDVEGDAITFYLTAPANGSYGAIEDSEDVDLDACPSGGGGSAEVRFLATNKNDAGSNYANMAKDATQLVGNGTAKLIALGASGCGLNDENKKIGYRADVGSSKMEIVFKVDATSTLDIYVNQDGKSNRTYQLASFSSAKALSAITPSDYTSASVVTTNVSATGAAFASASYSTTAGTASVSLGVITITESGGIKISYTSLSAGYYVFQATGSSSEYIYGYDLTPSSGGSDGVDTDLEWETDLSSGVAKEVGDPDFTFTASADNNSIGAVTYSSSAPSVATVNATTGKVHVVAAGSATITATLADCGCYNGNTATYDITVTSSCSDVAGTVTATDLGCKGVELTVSGHTGEGVNTTVVKWFKDGTWQNDAKYNNKETVTVTSAGEWYAETTASGGCAMSSTSVTVDEIVSSTISPTIFADEFTVKRDRPAEYRLMQLSEGETIKSVTNTLSWALNNDFAIDGPDENNIVSIRLMITDSDPIGNGTITITIENECDKTEDVVITIHAKAADAKPQIAWIATGTKGDKTSVLADESTNTALYKALEGTGDYDLTPRNCYWSVSEADLIKEYSQYDLVILTDYPNSQTGPNGSGRSKSYTNALGLLIDHVPMLTFEAFVSGCPNWGFESNPTNTASTQNDLTLLCNAGDIFDDTSGTFAAGASVEVGDVSSGNQSLQGFELDAMPNYVFIAKITDGGTDYVTCCERQENMNARMMVFGLNANVMDAITATGQQMVIGFVDYLLKDENASIPDCSVIFKGTTDSDWSKTANWEGGSLPNPYASVRLDKPCVVADDAVAKAGYIKIHISTSDDTYTGSLTISPQAAMIVENNIYRVEDDDYTDYKPTEVGDLIVEADASHTGALIFNNDNGRTQATVEMYSPSHWETEGGKKKKYWSYVGIPIQSANIPEYFYNGFTYLYDETSGWIKKGNGATLHAFEGIGLSRDAAGTETFSGALASTKTQNITLSYTSGAGKGMNLIGNSWTAPIQIANFDADDFGDATATVYVYNTGRGKTEGTATSTTAGQWVPVPIATAQTGGYTGLKVIPAMNAFEVNTSSRTTLTLDYDKLVRGVETNLNEPMRAPRRDREPIELDAIMRVRVNGEKTHTDVWLQQDERFSEAFDNGWEAEYSECDNRSAQFYAQSELGKMAFLAKPDIEGTVLGFAPSRDGNDYTFTFHYIGGEDFYLNDIKLQQSVLIDAENTYGFTYAEGDTNRFYISRTPLGMPQTPTGVDGVVSDQPSVVRKLLINDHIYIIRDGRVYSIDGAIVK